MREESRIAVGLIGLGAMGKGVAQALLRAGLPLTVYDVRPEAVETSVAQGAAAVSSPEEMGAQCSVVACLVVNAEQTEEVLFGPRGAVAAMAPGWAVVTCSTVPPDYAVSVGRRLEEKGLLYLDAPVSGGVVKAAAGELSVMASGSAAAFAACAPLLDAMAAKVFRIGETPGQGSTVKMINQLLAGVHIAAAAEAIALGIKAGADPQQLFEIIRSSAGCSWMFENRVPHILAGDYTPMSAVNIFVKDLGIVLGEARKAAFPLPLTAAAHQMFLMAAAAGHGGEDDAAVIKIFPGIDLPGGPPGQS